MSFRIQDPTDPDSEYFIDALIDACEGAHAGGGAFAFLSAGGVRLFLKDSTFGEFLGRGRFELIVGVDAITDGKAVDELTEVATSLPGLGARVLVPTYPRSIFHPKFAWFDRGNGGWLLTGSGNLTAGGLRWNIEAFSVQELDADQMAATRALWDAFLQRTADCQFDPADPRVVALLERNTLRRKAMYEAGIEHPGEVEEDVIDDGQAGEGEKVVGGGQQPQPSDEVPPIEDETLVLIAEIPNGGDRWEQANFSKKMFIDFFGASTTQRRKAYFFHVRPDGTLGEQEVRQAVVVKSRNFRFELDAAKGLEYPVGGRPIGIFARIAVRTFLYMLLLPGFEGYEQITQLLDSRGEGVPRKMRRITFGAAEVKAAWPTSPIWRRLTI
ncbi:Predicted HKD family nuclease [Bordetella ansorpii]|uniref:Predicted HKD family nuclease n=1 Tax=Bordetella ansorpii TaxID=288768 RepID=A0A157L4K7_9BORD|nr:phospholipase D family protein [Bordetella ansorpii]SAH91597.1 Predicted HKD family nuclease [Bordetella ansorpii]